MPIISVRIPQLGEGLQEALLVEFLKQPGEMIKRDDPIYVMETDKATTDVESPYEGKLIEWTVETNSVLEIGTEIAKMEVAEGVKEMPAGHGPADDAPVASTSSGGSAVASGSAASSSKSADKKPKSSSTVKIPPKTRKYLKEKGLLDVVDQIPVTGTKMMPEDVDAYLAASANVASASSDEYDVNPLPQSQVVLNYRLSRGSKVCVPVTLMNEIDWTAIESTREKVRASGGPTGFAMACWCTVQALGQFPRFRSTLTADGKSFKTFHRVNLGIAVALEGDEMVTAVVRDADQMSESEFFAAYNEQVRIARDGNDQADESTSVTVSNIGKAGMRVGIPAIVAPAVATLAIGEAFWQPQPQGDSFEFKRTVTATLSFDHRIANGIGAANFLSEFKNQVEDFKLD